MKAKSSGTLSFLLLLILLFPVNAFAVVWDISNEDLEKVAFELKKFNTHLENLKNSELASLRGQQENLARQIEEIQQILPQLLGAVELNKSQTLSGLNKTNTKLDDLEAEVKNQVLDKIHQQNKNLELFRQGQESLKVGLAQDMEKFERASRKNFEEFATANNETLGRVVQQLEAQSATNKKGFNDTIALFRTEVIPAMAAENENSRKLMLNQLTQAKKETQKNLEAFSAKNQQLNQKLIEILEKSLQQGLDTKSLLDAIKKDLAIAQESLVGTNQNLADNKSVITEIQKSMVVANKNLMVADEKSNKLADSLKALQAQNIASNETLGVLKANLKQSSEFNKLADEKFNKLIDLSSKLAVHSKELEGAVKESAQRDDAGNTKVDLANEKLSRLIEILKTIVTEQAKLDPVATTLGNLQKEQEAMQKAQESFRKNQEEIKEALADLRRKANVSISRSDDIKKTLDQLRPAQKGAGGQ
ncbi:MAG: hypothetical protein COW89_11560 [Nitrospinae bacterium CG22_combo_CG10-13_8_21_14_all_47_10]|nr:MAG: hypothetical protein COW89_11560 [Nitrospinae bacterium CG22_combo_CG10-13_8_21_14_all_47_10]